MDAWRRMFACIVLMMALVVVCGEKEEWGVGFSLGQPQTLVKDRHLLAINCGSACGARCAKAGVKDRCLKYCGICCQECQCVPSGTYGNKDQCPCYRDKKNGKGRAKCP